MPDNENDKQDDLLLPVQPGSDVEMLVEKKLLPYEVQEIRSVVQEFDPEKLDKYNDGLVYEAYYAALNSDGFNKNSLYKALHISKKLFDYYMKTYPKFNAAINIGLADKQETMKTSLIERLYKLSQGMVLENEEIVEEEAFNRDGVSMGTRRKTAKRRTQVAPDSKALITLLGKLDKSWNPTLNVDVSGEVTNLDVTANVDIALDYNKLSPAALKEILRAQKLSRADDSKIELDKRLKSDLIIVGKDIPRYGIAAYQQDKEKEIEAVDTAEKDKLKLLLGGRKKNGGKKYDGRGKSKDGGKSDN